MHVFISDAHIRSDLSLRARRLENFLTGISGDLTGLYVLGDLFDFWFEYRTVFPRRYFRTLACLDRLIRSGKTVHYFPGNHEVATGDFFEHFGFTVHRGETELVIDGRKILVAHGHLIDNRPWTALWKRLLTSRFNHRLYRLIHPDLGISLAQAVARLSRRQSPSKNLARRMEAYAAIKLRDHDIVVLAHSHAPAFKELAAGKYYVNTGDWIEHFSYAKLDRSGIRLCYYCR